MTTPGIATRRIIALLIAFVSILPAAYAQDNTKTPSRRERTEWMKQMRRYKADFIAGRLKLSEEQKAKFVPLYEEMDAKNARIEHEARQMERDIRKKGENATDTEYEKAAEALCEMKARQAAVEAEYLEKYKTVLNPRQLFQLKSAEREFTRQLMERHRHSGKNRKN